MKSELYAEEWREKCDDYARTLLDIALVEIERLQAMIAELSESGARANSILDEVEAAMKRRIIHEWPCDEDRTFPKQQRSE